MHDLATKLIDRFFDRLQRAKLAFLFLFGILGVIAGLLMNNNYIQPNTIIGQDYLAAGLGCAVSTVFFHSILWIYTQTEDFKKSVKKKKSDKAKLANKRAILIKSFEYFENEQKCILKKLSEKPSKYSENARGLYTLYSSGYIVRIQNIGYRDYVYDLNPDFKDLVKSLIDKA